MKKAIVAVLLTSGLFSTISLVACGPTETRMNTFSVGSSPTVEVKVGNGDVELIVGAEGEITVTAELRNPDKVDYKVSQDGDKITVDAKTRSNSRADVTVTLPANTEFEVDTGNGDIDVADVQAPGRVSCGNGSITFERLKGDVTGNLGNGDITINDVAGSFILSDGNGDINLKDVAGSFKLNVGNGDIELHEATGSFNLSIGNGDIRFQGELPPGSESTFNVGNGSVTVELMGSPSVALDLEAEQKGKVRCNLPVTVSEQSEYRLVGTIGNGEATLKVRTGTGNITIR